MRHKASFRSLSDRALAAISVRRALFRACTIALLFLGEMNSAVPDWLRAASLASTGTSYEANTPAVLLLDETVTTVKESGEITYLRRRAFRLMDSRARTYGVFAIGFHKDEPISGLAGWSISAQRKELEVKGKDAIETSYSTENLYDDARRLVLRIPGAEAGSVIGYEYEQKKRPGMLENIYEFQREIPVRRARLTLQLPRGWEFRASWRNHDDVKAREDGPNRWVWDLENIPAMKLEPAMPPAQSIAARLLVTCAPSRQDLSGPHVYSTSWRQIGSWYGQLTAGRRAATEGIRRKVIELTAHSPDLKSKLLPLASFVQRDIRYVAIEIGIGGFQPHYAGEVFTNRYGDCKDKATLLAAMFNEIGIESYYVLLNSERGVVDKSFPTTHAFDHVILAFRPPDDPGVRNWDAAMDVPNLGRMILFDPTDPVTPLGSLPAAEQASTGLLVTSGGGEILELPLALPSSNHVVRKAALQLDPEGALSGRVEETYSGEMAARERVAFRETPGLDRAKLIEKDLAPFLDARLEKASVVNLAYTSDEFGINYNFSAPNYARRAGDLLFFRGRVLGRDSEQPPESDRKYPIVLPVLCQRIDIYEIKIPEGYVVDELPPPVSVEYSFGKYSSRTEKGENLIRYSRTLEMRQLAVLPEQIADLSQFYRAIAADERGSVVLKRK